MKKTLLIVLTLILLLGGCDQIVLPETAPAATTSLATVAPDAPADAPNEPQTQTADEAQQEPAAQPDTPTQAPEAVEIDAPTVPLPSLPEGAAQMRFFEDGIGPVQVVKCFDGDTAEVKIDGDTYKVRFIAIDTPEISSPHVDKQPWAEGAKAFTEEMLYGARQVVLQMDDDADIKDDYGRLIAWVWADGELVQAKLVEAGLAQVKYLYGDYAYTDTLLELEAYAQDAGLKIWGEIDESYTYQGADASHTLGQLKSVSDGTDVKVQGVVTNMIGNSAFIEDDTGAVYVYLGSSQSAAIAVGSEIIVGGSVKEYKGLLEVDVSDARDIFSLAQNVNISPHEITIGELNESLESRYVRISGATVTGISSDNGNGFNVYVSQGGSEGVVRVDAYVDVDASLFQNGDVIDIVGNVAQHQDTYQIMISGGDAISY